MLPTLKGELLPLSASLSPGQERRGQGCPRSPGACVPPRDTMCVSSLGLS